ncbi:hypothetical protein KIL84_007211, partial [Mauremys mutica]
MTDHEWELHHTVVTNIFNQCGILTRDDVLVPVLAPQVSAKSYIPFSHFHLNQPKQVGVYYELSEEEKFYRNALIRMPDDPAALDKFYLAVMGIVTEVEQSLQYQCLWDMQAENIYNRLGEDLNKWQALLVQIRKARGTFDNAETRKEFGPVIIDYGKSRQELEQHSVDTASTSDAVTFITYVQSLKCKIKQFEKQVEVVLEELQDLKGVWSELWDQIDQMKEQPWVSVQPRKAMGCISVGICQVGTWGCFDEFNRLEECMLSAVSQLVQCIQEALQEHCNPNYDK